MPHPPTRRASATVALALTLALALLGPVVLAGPAGAADAALVVWPGQSIQAALDAAPPGGRVVVHAGTYAEQLTLTKNGTALVGVGAVLVPPPAPVTNTCSGLAGVGTDAGICVTGRDVTFGPFNGEHRPVTSVGRRTRDVVVQGFEVRGFSGPNVALVGTADTRLDGNQLVDGNQYGALSVGSKANRISHNTVTAGDTLRSIGICTDDAGPAVVNGNDVSGYIFGLCVETRGTDIANNGVHDNCFGVFVDPGISALVRDNHIYANNGPCGANTGFGVVLQGAVDTDVRDNLIEGHTSRSAGLVIVDAPTPGPQASDNLIRRNVFKTNTLDIVVASAGPDNVVVHNRCTTSQPAGLCG